MQDEVRDKSVAFVIRTGKETAKITEEMLKWAVRQYQKQGRKPASACGKQSVKKLVMDSRGVKSVGVTSKGIRSFEKTARKYGMQYAAKKGPEKGQYTVFFRAGDEDVLNAAFAEYTTRTLGRGKRKPSLLKQLAQFEAAEAKETPVHKKNREAPER